MAHLLSLLLLLPRACAELQISAPTSQAALQGSDVLLNCSFSVDDRHVDPKYLAVLWYFKEKIILTSDSKGKDLSPRISFNERAALAGDASIKLSDVNIEDEGLYRCVVIYAPDKKEKEITLNVLVRPTIQIHNKYVSERSLVCSARGFYPPPIGITWLRDKEVLKNATLDKPLRGPDGAYTTESTLTIADDRGHTNDIFICKVHHESLEEPLQESTLLIYRDKRNAWVTTASILVGLAMVGAVVGFLLWKQRLQKKASGRFSLNDIQGPEKLVDGEEVVLICTATNCPGTPRVTWFEKGKVGPLEILEPPDSGPGESEQPLTRTYAIRKKAEGFGDYTTSLRFRFCFQKHNRLSFICRFTSDKVFKEKTFHCTSVYAKPQLAEPIKASLCISGEVVCSISLQNFYPQQIKIGWKCERGDLPAKLSSKEKFQTNPDFTVNVCSKVRIPGDFFRDPEGKLSVTWEHECLAAPGSCALSARSPGYPWNPVVEEIKTPLLFHGIPVKLECKISNYFPDALTANWLIKNNGSPEELPVPDKENVLVTKSQNKEDFTHSCTSSLTVTPTLGAHQGAEYVCRVSHPSLETPIERRTEKLRILAKPCRKEPIKATLMDSSRIYFSLYLQNFYPRDIKVTWYNDRKTCKSLLPSNEILTQSEDLTSNVNSWVETLGTIFEDPQDKVTVTWKHASLGVTDSISLCVRDFPWRPQVEDIQIPNMEANKKTALKCRISGYFPDKLSVRWFKKQKDQETALPAEKYEVPAVKSKKQDDRTLRCESCLKFTPHLGQDQGAEFICRVSHPTLEQPIEKTTRPLNIAYKGTPDVSDIKFHNRLFTLEVDNFYPRDIQITWRVKPESADKFDVLGLPTTDVIENKNGTFRATSACQPPNHEKQKAKSWAVVAVVDHKSLEKPVQRTFSPRLIRDLANELTFKSTRETQGSDLPPDAEEKDHTDQPYM